MNESTIISGVVTILQLFFAKNPTVEEILPFIEQIGVALPAAQAGQAFSLSFPEIIGGKAGTSTLGWSPTVAA